MRISDWSSDVCSSDLEMALGAVEITLAEDATRSDRDLRLADVIARAQRVAFGIEEDQHAIALIIVEDEIDRKSVVWGKSVAVSVDLGGRRIIKQKTTVKDTAKSTPQ